MALAPIPIPDRMKALVLRGQGFENLAIEEIPVPRPGPGQVLVRVDAAGICASLIKTIAQGGDHTYFHGWDIARFPVILGDEGAVTLVAAGAGMEHLAPGTRYVVQPAVDAAPVNHRERYRDAGRGVRKVACGYTLPGHLAEYMLVPEEVFAAECLVPIPDPSMPYAHAAIAEPISCCVSGQFHHMHLVQDGPTSPRRAQPGLRRGGVTVVVGLGAMGRMHLEVAIAQGPGTVIASDPIEARRARAEALFGARAARAGCRLVCTAPEDLAGAVGAASGGRGADDLVIAVGHPAVIAGAMPLLARGGVANLFAGLRKGEEVVGFDANRIHYDETVVTGSSGGTAWDIARTLEWMAAGSIDAGPHIAKIGDLDHAIEMIHDVREQRLEGKAVLYPARKVEHAFTVEGWSAADEAAWLAGAPA
jgi:L-iditol 2-dehydrogenase